MATGGFDKQGALTEEQDELNLMKPRFKSGVFNNPFETWKMYSFWDVMKLMKIFAVNDTSGIPWGNQEVQI